MIYPAKSLYTGFHGETMAPLIQTEQSVLDELVARKLARAQRRGSAYGLPRGTHGKRVHRSSRASGAACEDCRRRAARPDQRKQFAASYRHGRHAGREGTASPGTRRSKRREDDGGARDGDHRGGPALLRTLSAHVPGACGDVSRAVRLDGSDVAARVRVG